MLIRPAIDCARACLSATGAISSIEHQTLRSNMGLRKKGPVDLEIDRFPPHHSLGRYFAIRLITASIERFDGKRAHTTSGMIQRVSFSSTPTTMWQLLSFSWPVAPAG